MNQDFILYEKSGRVVTLTMNRPDKGNAVGGLADCEALVAALRRAEADPEVSVLILTGAGAIFSAGGDLKGMRERNGIGPLATPADTRANYRRGVQQIPKAMIDLEIATIAAVNGHAVGLGCDLAALCDMRVASATARFAASFLKMGIVPGDGGAWILPRVIGYPKAAEMILTGDSYTADQALGMGLVGSVVEADQVLTAAHALAARVAVNPPRSVRLAKRLLREGQNIRLSEMLELSAAFQALAHETEDHREALDAFFDKRPPNFTGA